MDLPLTLDLHMHTTISDGTDTPQEIVGKVEQANIDIFSVTDHDAIEGSAMIATLLAERKKTDAGNKIPAFIKGVEFSGRDRLGKYHILGYAYDSSSPEINDLVEKGHSLRMRKVMDRLEFMKDEFGFTFEQKDIDLLFKNPNPGKPHIAKMMIEYGYATSIKNAMENYLNKKKFKSAYLDPEEIISAILAAGGIPVLAHAPYGDGSQLIIGKELDVRIRHLLNFGLMGAECFYSGFTKKLTYEMLNLAGKYDLYITAGSDYHGTTKMVLLGDTGLENTDEAPEKLREFLDRVLETPQGSV